MKKSIKYCKGSPKLGTGCKKCVKCTGEDLSPKANIFTKSQESLINQPPNEDDIIGGV